MKITVTALYSCGECVAPSDWNTSATPRPYRLYYVIGGEAHYTVGGVKKKLGQGCCYLFPSSMPFNVVQSEEHHLNHLYFDFMMNPTIVSTEPLCCRPEDHPLFPIMITLMRNCVQGYRYEKRRELYDTVVSALATFLSLFLEIAMPKRCMDNEIVGALEYIEQHYAEDISVKSIAGLLFLDEDYFIKKFKRYMGVTPYAYIRNLRMAVVRELCYNGEKLTDATALAGFKYPSSYCRAKRRSGGSK